MSVALYEINEFLTLNDVAEYLTDKCNYDFNLECSIDQNRLIETIVQLVLNHKLHPVFHYIGSVDCLEKKVITSKSGSFINHEIVLSDITHDISVRDYYFISDKNFDKLIENNCSNYINVINCTIEPYHEEGKQEIVENNILHYRKVKEDFSINFHDLRYPKLDLDKLFNQTEAKAKADTEVIEKLREQVADLTAENDKLRAQLGQQADKPADDLKDVPHQSYRTVDRVMYAMAKISNLDNTEPYSQNNPSLNASITTILQNDGLTLEYQAVGKWLSRINDIKPLK